MAIFNAFGDTEPKANPSISTYSNTSEAFLHWFIILFMFYYLIMIYVLLS